MSIWQATGAVIDPEPDVASALATRSKTASKYDFFAAID
jgi:hypothetical protein